MIGKLADALAARVNLKRVFRGLLHCSRCCRRCNQLPPCGRAALRLLLVDRIVPATPDLMLPLLQLLQVDVDRKRVAAVCVPDKAVA